VIVVRPQRRGSSPFHEKDAVTAVPFREVFTKTSPSWA
jgi:hypothetical protein